MAKNLVRITENELHKIIKESVKRVIRENYFDNSMVTFILRSRANGNLTLTVPYQDFINQKFKLDYLWNKLSEKYGNILKGNGCFEVSKDSPHREEIEKYL